MVFLFFSLLLLFRAGNGNRTRIFRLPVLRSSRERDTRIELAYPAWKAGVLTTVLIPLTATEDGETWYNNHYTIPAYVFASQKLRRARMHKLYEIKRLAVRNSFVKQKSEGWSGREDLSPCE